MLGAKEVKEVLVIIPEQRQKMWRCNPGFHLGWRKAAPNGIVVTIGRILMWIAQR